ncbi:MAG: SDR family NAD(P)-dependent oxidoreductase, partial [Candidatus Omnitrophica bacterium]|nr:SDR family NAD(P)-dependent oxidoreductase [Candidatus Omnitrophota bacterium]
MRQTNSKSITGEKFLSGRIAHVTGGAGGIGFSTARRLLEEGASVTLSGRTQERLGEAVEKL